MRRLLLVLAFHIPVWAVMVVWIAAYVVAAIWSTAGLPALFAEAAERTRAVGLVREQIAFAAKSALSANVTFLALRIDVFIVSALLSAGIARHLHARARVGRGDCGR